MVKRERFEAFNGWYVPAEDFDALAERCERLEAALRGLLRRDQNNTCQHDETHRGGAIWEICDNCGRQWADDRGGKPEWSDPPEWTAAEKALGESP